jgi:hypothetical protein
LYNLIFLGKTGGMAMVREGSLDFSQVTFVQTRYFVQFNRRYIYPILANYVEILEDTPADEVEEAVAVEEEAPAPPSPDVPAAPPAPPVPLAPPAPAASEATEDHGVVATAIYE